MYYLWMYCAQVQRSMAMTSARRIVTNDGNMGHEDYFHQSPAEHQKRPAGPTVHGQVPHQGNKEMAEGCASGQTQGDYMKTCSLTES